ncbi:MAG TPA: VOC family protein [Thermodesulfobacteriota bacterium]|nr:VOC family protein [Thermodesulfobacteriota bacterium]
MPFSIEHVSIRVRDLDASAAYYERMFGARIILRRNLSGGRKIIFLKIGESMMELMGFGAGLEPMDSREHYGIHHIGIKTDHFEATVKDLKQKGAEFLGEPFEPTPGINLVFLRDPNGTVIELAQRDPKVFQAAVEKGTANW